MRRGLVRCTLVLFILVAMFIAGGTTTAAGCLTSEFSVTPRALCPGALLTVGGSLTNSCDSAMQVDVTIKIEGPGIVFVDTKKILVAAGSSMPYSQSFVVPKNAIAGAWSFHLEATSGTTEKTTADGDVTIDAC